MRCTAILDRTGNGITYSAIAAELLTATVLGKPHRYSDTFAFDR